MAIADIMNSGIGGNGSLSTTFNTNLPQINKPKPYAFSMGSGLPVTPNANGGLSSLGGPGYQAYMKPSTPIQKVDSLGDEYSFDKDGKGYNALNYKPTKSDVLGGKGSGTTGSIANGGQQSFAQNWGNMNTDQQMGVVNAGMNMVGLLGNFFK